MNKAILIFLSTLLVSFSISAKTYDCNKKYCNKMSSCAEANYQLNVCAFQNLDRDRDGIPCENVCGKGGKKENKKAKSKSKKDVKKSGKTKKQK